MDESVLKSVPSLIRQFSSPMPVTRVSNVFRPPFRVWSYLVLYKSMRRCVTTKSWCWHLL